MFFGRAHDRVNVLFWDRGGFVVECKRLEKGRFRWPRPSEDAAHLEVDGIDLSRVTRLPAWQPSISMDGVSRF